MSRWSRFAIAGALCALLCCGAPVSAGASGSGSTNGGNNVPCNAGSGSGNNTGGTISTTEGVHTCPRPGNGGLPPEGKGQPYPSGGSYNWCGTGTTVMRKEYPSLSAPINAAGDRNAIFPNPMGGTITYVVHELNWYTSEDPSMYIGLVVPETWGIAVVSGTIEVYYVWNGTACVPTSASLRGGDGTRALFAWPGITWPVGPQPPFAPSADNLWAKMKNQWAIGQVQSAPASNLYVMVPTCNWISGTTLPTQPQYISEDFASQDAAGMTVYVEITVEAVPGPIYWSFGDGAPAYQGDSGSGAPHQAQYFGNGNWGSCANEHIYKHVGSVTISASEQFTVYGWATYYNGSTAITLQPQQVLSQGTVPFGQPVNHLVQQVEGVPHS